MRKMLFVIGTLLTAGGVIALVVGVLSYMGCFSAMDITAEAYKRLQNRAIVSFTVGLISTIAGVIYTVLMSKNI